MGVVVPLSGPVDPTGSQGRSGDDVDGPRASRASLRRGVSDSSRVSIEVPARGRPLIAALRTALAHMLITRDGPVLRPGTRSYARSWIRDGAMISESLLRTGHADVAADYLRWYAPHQFANGKVPCCVDERGADPVPEHDSAGELIFLVAEVYRYTGRPSRSWKRCGRTSTRRCAIWSLCGKPSVPTPRCDPRDRAFYGLLPASISHEGYSAKPMHSYWDDFWGLKGYDGAIAIAMALGRNDDARRLEAQRDEFRVDLAASLQHVVAAHGIAYLPGAAELGDFDPTSTTIAIAPGGELHRLPSDLVLGTFERYWREFVDRRDGRRAWEDYTPYELRNVSTFVRLGWRDRAHELLAFFMAGRRPAAWNQWPEVDRPRSATAPLRRRPAARLGRLGLHPRGARPLRLRARRRPRARARRRRSTGMAGETGHHGEGPAHARTGTLSYSLRRDGGNVILQVAGGSQVPPGGFVLVWPGREPPPASTRVNGQAGPMGGQGAAISASSRHGRDRRST